MKRENIAVIALVIIVAGALSAYLLLLYYPDITGNLFTQNRAPIAHDDFPIVYKNFSEKIDIMINDEDPDGDSLNISSVTQPSNGTVNLENNTITYNPDQNYCGDDTFTYIVNDGEGGTASARVYVTVECEKILEYGDCADIHYIARYASNNTIVDSSYLDTQNKTDGTPLNVFVSLNKSASPPEQCPFYSPSPLGMIEGFIPDIIGLEEGDEKQINIPAAKAFGVRRIAIGDSFYTTGVAPELNQTVEVINITNEIMSLKWINVEELGAFTMPQQILLEDLTTAYFTFHESLPPYYLWENASEIINITDDAIEVKTTPTKNEKLSDEITMFAFEDDFGFIFPDATTASWNDTHITITSAPVIGDEYTLNLSSYGLDFIMTIQIENITADQINTSISYTYEDVNETTYQVVNATVTFNRIISLGRIYKNIPITYVPYIFEEDLQKKGYSFHELAGEDLIYEVRIEEIYKTS